MMLGETVFAKENLYFNPYDKSQFVEVGRRGTRIDDRNTYSMTVQFDGLSRPITVGGNQVETAVEVVERLQLENEQFRAFVEPIAEHFGGYSMDESMEIAIRARQLLASLSPPESE